MKFVLKTNNFKNICIVFFFIDKVQIWTKLFIYINLFIIFIYIMSQVCYIYCIHLRLISATISILFILYWHLYLYDVPDNHPKISPEEYEYLLQNVGISAEVT